MADVFVCHASEDRDAAGRMVVALEGAGIRCWIAPRDVTPGADYAQEIITAIGRSRLLLLVLSSASNESPHVRREVERAVSRDVPILPVRTEPITPSRSLEYYISDAQWFDATQDLGDHAGLVAAVRRYLTLNETVLAGGSPPPSDLGPVEDALATLVGRYGAELGNDPRRVGALLRDLAGERRAEIAAVVAAAEEGVPDALAHASDTMTGATVRRLTETLQEHRALAPDAAEKAVTAWALALGITITTPETEVPEPEPPPPRTERRPEPPVEKPPPIKPLPAKQSPDWRRWTPALGIGGAIAAVVLVVAVMGGGSDGPDITVPTSTIPGTTEATTTTDATTTSTSTTTTTSTSVAGSLATGPVTDTTGSLSTVAPVDWGLTQFNGHIYSASDISEWEAEYNERGWKVTATTPGFRLSLFADDRASDAFMEEVLAGSEVPSNCDFASQGSSDISGGYRAWANTYDCDGGGTYELWSVWEPAFPTYFVVFEAYYVTDQELEAIQSAFSSSLWIRP